MEISWRGFALASDVLRLRPVAVDAVDVDVVFAFEERAQLFFSPGPAGAFPDDWIPPPDDPIRITERGYMRLQVYPIEQQTGRPVAFNNSMLEIGFGRGIEGDNGPTDRRTNRIALQPDEPDFDLEAVFAGEPQLVRSFVKLAPENIVSTEVIAVYHPPFNDGEPWGPPAGLRLLHHDASGNVVFDALPRVDEVIEGRIAAKRPLEGGGPYLALYDICHGPPTETHSRTATLKLSTPATEALGIEVTHTFEWTVHPGDPPVAAPDNVECEGPLESDGLGEVRGCGCSTGSSDAGLTALLLTPIVAGLRRRRRAGARSDRRPRGAGRSSRRFLS